MIFIAVYDMNKQNKNAYHVFEPASTNSVYTGCTFFLLACSILERDKLLIDSLYFIKMHLYVNMKGDGKPFKVSQQSVRSSAMATSPTTLIVSIIDKINFPINMAMTVFKQIFGYVNIYLFICFVYFNFFYFTFVAMG